MTIEQNTNVLVQVLENTIDQLKEKSHIRVAYLDRLAETNDSEALKAYLSYGFDINERGYGNATVAHYLDNVTPEFLEEMISYGLNIHAINQNGESPLLVLARRGINEPLQKILMQKGLNPYNTSFDGTNCFTHRILFGRTNRENIYVEHSLFDKRDSEFDDLLAGGSYELAYISVANLVSNLGGLNYLIANSNKIEIYNIIKKLQVTLILTGRFNEAYNLMKMLVDVKTVYCKDAGGSIITLPAFLTEDYKSFFYCISEEIMGSREILGKVITGYLFAKIAGVQSYIDHYTKLLQKLNINKHTMYYPIHDMLLEENPLSLEVKERELESDKFLDEYILEGKVELLYVQGLYYAAKKDYVTAELMLRRSMEESKKKIHLLQHNYPLALIMVQGIYKFKDKESSQ